MQTLFGLTINAAKGDEKGVALQAIVFWSSEEIDHKGSKPGETSDSDPHSLFIETALSWLVSVLLETLYK
ncbi:putative armadillo-like helical, importin beta family [Helianthus annuus]|nr:putative armadillo-like helical, importin beta family [Helianthus annuus]